ncbi:MAG: hypothetical protein Q7S44_00160 [bacterium]|nr:hypothetical protein [bacterium]
MITKREKLFLLSLIVVLTTAFLVTILSKKPEGYKKGVSEEGDRAVAVAQLVYQRRVTEGVDLSTGPCLSNDLMPGWVADLVHSPRQPVDDLPENQCVAFQEGRARHFVELDLKGNVVRAK